MRCPVCNSTLVYKGGENKEDYGCKNLECRSRNVLYNPHVGVREGWYYATQYHLPFEWIDVSNRAANSTYGWFALVGNGSQTILQGVRLVERPGMTAWNERTQDNSAPYRECIQEDLLVIPYEALPVNDEFNSRFNSLRDRMMEGWFRANEEQSRPINGVAFLMQQRAKKLNAILYAIKETSPSAARITAEHYALSNNDTGSFEYKIAESIDKAFVSFFRGQDPEFDFVGFDLNVKKEQLALYNKKLEEAKKVEQENNEQDNQS